MYNIDIENIKKLPRYRYNICSWPTQIMYSNVFYLIDRKQQNIIR